MSASPSPTIGVTAVVCCFNSATRLPQTLAHLAAQRVPPGVGFEVVVVDNASTDDTATVARRLWPADHPHPLRVVEEPLPGLSNARVRGLTEAKYPFVSFIDDDNWICPDWVAVVVEILTAQPDVAVVGSWATPVLESPPAPAWFQQHSFNYALGPQGEQACDRTGWWLYGAGLTIRAAAWQQLLAGGFRFVTGDRTGAGLGGCGDIELCFALYLNGWRGWYDPRLRLEHYMPAGRVRWAYFTRLIQEGAASFVSVEAYRYHLRAPSPGFRGWLDHAARHNWIVLSAATLLRLASHPVGLVRSMTRSADQHADCVVPVIRDLGRLRGLLQLRGDLGRLTREIGAAKWFQPHTTGEAGHA